MSIFRCMQETSEIDTNAVVPDPLPKSVHLNGNHVSLVLSPNSDAISIRRHVLAVSVEARPASTLSNHRKQRIKIPT